ncbi:MAG TPA: polymer-forming cytoskeletal protein [Xanthobacteraceae bacterium]|nr:polymer-forming cytoskeletal protein [Xanthobacteraceae bacterium]
MFKRKGLDSKPLDNKTANANANASPIITTIVPPQAPVVERNAAKPQADAEASTVSCIGSGMSIIGNIECNGPAQVFGRIKGEVHASADLLIGDGALVEGTVIAQEVTVCGTVKGTVRGGRVRLRKGGTVDGDIFHHWLSIEEDAVFEGTVRRVENPTEMASSGDAAAKKSQPAPTLPPAIPLDIDGDLGPVIDTDLRPH